MKLFILVAAIISACAAAQPPPENPGNLSACGNLVRLRCPEGCAEKKCAGGDTCHEVLARAELIIDLNQSCVARAKSGRDVRACGPSWHDACGGIP